MQKYAFDSIINKWVPSNGPEEVEQKKSKSKYKRSKKKSFHSYAVALVKFNVEEKTPQRNKSPAAKLIKYTVPK